jgi:hypothetical protein
MDKEGRFESSCQDFGRGLELAVQEEVARKELGGEKKTQCVT